jgi:hypothetical protein
VTVTINFAGLVNEHRHIEQRRDFRFAMQRLAATVFLETYPSLGGVAGLAEVG